MQVRPNSQHFPSQHPAFRFRQNAHALVNIIQHHVTIQHRVIRCRPRVCQYRLHRAVRVSERAQSRQVGVHGQRQITLGNHVYQLVRKRLPVKRSGCHLIIDTVHRGVKSTSRGEQLFLGLLVFRLHVQEICTPDKACQN